ncbi:NAD(P)/FAD-dependent oxidoreductase [Aporhodopirellula aestuarii]|uniref:Tryptophan 7-halogenase n=1 Tax=Aporhodopirellula aestuarii TaxID=2950107 RepID=A0ABT0TZA2_9BACT|nr:tryptophan 7-halogenase [Aporhodopirellula aestuarii]MCM2369928.1 tryptophan 7-halogenase [Aporhodopirellula aestuarii]
MEFDSDVLIIGSGFGGCLTGILLRKLGYRVCVVDKNEHPRFAIGESSTPLADRTLKRIATEYGLDWLKPLSAYGTAQNLAGEVTVGLKRGFSYFHHTADQEFQPRQDHSTELLVSASTDDSVSDTHWLRSSVDHYIARHMSRENVTMIENFDIDEIISGGRWRVRGVCPAAVGLAGDRTAVELTSRFIIDASGASTALSKVTKQNDVTELLASNTGAIFGHFSGLRDWNDLVVELGGDISPHPYVCHHAAVHHLIDEGWIWQLGFDNGVTSCGIVFNRADVGFADDDRVDVEERWRRTVQKYPTLSRQFAGAELIAPARLQEKKRLQFLREPAAADRWLSLPSAVGFVDPLHSTGIAQTLAAVEKIAAMFSECDSPDVFPSPESLHAYGSQVRAEILWIDRLVSTCYAASFDFPLYVAATMTYFVVVTAAEREGGNGFLSVDAADLVACVARVSERVFELRRKHSLGVLSSLETVACIAWIREQLEPFNHVGLFDPAKQNLYHHTAPLEKRV